MVRKLYDEDAYRTEFDAEVIATAAARDGAVWVTLSQTCFFPEEGGQSPDRGTINGLAVVDVQISGDTIRHKVMLPADGDSEAAGEGGSTAGGDGLVEGESVHGRIDWEFRFRNMQMHTGEHIFSGLVHSRYGYHNVGFHLSERTATMDYDGKLTEAQLQELEDEANRAIVRNLAVHAWYPAADVLAGLSYRSKKEIDGAVRLVEIADVDLCACCAPHVRSTGEVGCFKLIGWENYKGGVRVSYRCGLRAMEDYGERLSLLTKLSQLLSVKTEDLAETVAKREAERWELAYALVAKDRALALTEIASMTAADGRLRLADGRIDGAGILFLQKADASLLRYVTDEMKKVYSGVVCVLLPVGEDVWRYQIEQDNGDVSMWLQMLRERFAAKGGGPKNSVQGSVTAPKRELALALAKLLA